MKNIFNAPHILNRQQSSMQWLLELPPLARLVLGLLASAVFAWFVPQLLVIFTTGMWAGALRMSLANIIGVSVLMLLNLLGHSLNRVLLVSAVCAALAGCYEIWFVARTWQATSWQSWIAQLVVPSLILYLNAYLLVRWKKAMSLEHPNR